VVHPCCTRKRCSLSLTLLGAFAVAQLGATSRLDAQQTQADAAAWARDLSAVRDGLTRHLSAFENLDWAPFRESFADARRAAPGGPPFLQLRPEGMRIVRMGPSLALVTFHLRNVERLARRTVVFRRGADRWQIVHIHASNTPPPRPQ
jgi:SnoaL-like domain